MHNVDVSAPFMLSSSCLSSSKVKIQVKTQLSNTSVAGEPHRYSWFTSRLVTGVCKTVLGVLDEILLLCKQNNTNQNKNSP